MLSKEDNERLTQVGEGTPMGNVFRRYWLPALLSSELERPDGPPVRVRLLGEDLVAFRDTADAIGLVEAYCAHRRAPLFLGRNEQGGLRCVYHGWKYDRTGQCVHMPTEPKESTYKERIKLKAYPTWEAGGMIWTYMGPQPAPPPPDYELCRAPATHRFVTRTVQDCNYLQALEGGLDSAHATILHNMTIGNLSWLDDFELTTPKLEVRAADYGFEYSGIRKLNGRYWVRVYQYVMPATQIRGRIAPVRGETAPPRVPSINGHLWVPIDDVTVSVLNFSYSADPSIPLDREFALEADISYGRGPDDLLPDLRLKRNWSNDFLIDREVQKTETFTGIEGVNTQDAAVQEGMGPIVDRSKEHLGSTDRAIVAMRRLLLEAVRTVESGGVPKGADPSSYSNLRAVDHYADSESAIPELVARERLARF
jgi:nitrite reductase/ring-hydroxylating ferredoxin subunit